MRSAPRIWLFPLYLVPVVWLWKLIVFGLLLGFSLPRGLMGLASLGVEEHRGAGSRFQWASRWSTPR
ncbi:MULTISPECIES: hypothetical protein [unclassified Curtobacterium]|uniref:hypothetical protein n=1 Tax=unclassified Curtobacterium TaxID=257496 RepID=UPI000826274F|nr:MULTISPECIES: hypothetical protein [unclassified Curtobacterium]WIA96161.1 hypothetical protein QOL16_13775 [Curtobacterium sp. MCBA15_004]